MTLTRRELSEIADEIGAEYDAGTGQAYRARYNVAPTDRHPIALARDGRRGLEMATWGLAPARAGGAVLINARAETALVKPSFREAYEHRRCIVPADGFFEWQKTPEGRLPIWYHRADGKLLYFAGLFDEEADGRRFTVLTTPANMLIAPVHDRMPAIIPADEVTTWLERGSPSLLEPAAEELLVATPVSKRVSSVKNDDPGCLEPRRATGQLRLL